MNTTKLFTIIVAVLSVTAASAAEKDNSKPAAAPAPGKLFGDDILCKGKGVDVRRSQLDEAVLQFKANMNARGQTIPESRIPYFEAQILDRILLTQLLLNRATEQDRVKAKDLAAKFLKDSRDQAGSQEAMDRQLLAMGFSQRQFEDQIMDRAISECVVERELKDKIVISDEEAKTFYDKNGQEFDRPEMIRAAHILLSTRDPITNAELTDEQKKQRKEQLEKLLVRARKGEDFGAMAKEYSEDPGSKEKGGEYTFPRGQMVPEFETAALALGTNDVSDIVITRFGYHIIKLYEKIAPRRLTLSEVNSKLKEVLAQRELVEKRLPEYSNQLKKDAGITYLNGAKAPEDLPPEPDAKKPEPKKESN
jgi:peptidyl-prolyl cis-trans isomerase C